jgi:hypothetical protein
VTAAALDSSSYPPEQRRKQWKQQGRSYPSPNGTAEKDQHRNTFRFQAHLEGGTADAMTLAARSHTR